MGFPVGYTELLLPKLLLHTLSLLSLLRSLLNTLFYFLGLPDFLEPDPTKIPEYHSVSSLLIRDILPVVKFSELVDPPDSCAVCLYEFEEEDEIRQLSNCRHIFHRNCLDRWMGYDRKTCPLCRSTVIPEEMVESLNEKVWASTGVIDFYGDFSQFSSSL